MTVSIYMIGKIKNRHLRALTEDYCHRIERTVPCAVHSLRESRYRDEDRDAALIMAEEAEEFHRKVPAGAMTIALDKEGRRMDSIRFSEFMNEHLFQLQRNVCFLVGGFRGLAPAVMSEADVALSLSDFTFPHELSVALILEQVYRSITMIKHIPYHK
ncbi:MAG: 23S rRNA (pseudouridine(1915)-N(3))-methyltransferase RlmH [Acidobacteria bacterium]|nr:23S rRNA (pseudouridine(1915)-N(3))-methyltransferase RlmH [Acidobacteriota bacterium]